MLRAIPEEKQRREEFIELELFFPPNPFRKMVVKVKLT